MSKEYDKPSFYNFGHKLFGDGLLTAPANIWVGNRKMANPMFNSRILDTFMSSFVKCSRVMLDSIRKNVGGPEFEISVEFDLYTLNAGCDRTIGVDLTYRRKEALDVLHTFFRCEHAVVQRFLKPWLYPDAIYDLTVAGQEQNANLLGLRNTFSKFVETAQQRTTNAIATEPAEEDEAADSVKKTTFLSWLQDPPTRAQPPNHEQLVSEMITILTAGQETSAITLGFAAFQLAINPDIQNKVFEEQRNIFGDSTRPPVAKDLGEMVYLERVIKETLRMYPPLAIFGRKLQNDLTMGDKVIPAGAEVGLIPSIIHRRPDYYPDPLKFDPDRFLPENVMKRHPYAFLPFSVGRRNCIGRVYAMMEMKVMLSMLVREFELLPGSITDIESELTLMFVLRSMSGINIRIAPRKQVTC